MIETGADGLAHLFADSAPEPDFAKFRGGSSCLCCAYADVLESVSGIPSGESLTTDANLAPYLTSDDVDKSEAWFPKFPCRAEREIWGRDGGTTEGGARSDSRGYRRAESRTSHGASIHRELELLVRSGLTPSEALAAATSVPAAAFHLDDRGVIAPGKRADLLLVKGDPTQDILATRNIVSVWKLGVEDDRAGYRAAIEKEKKDVAKAAQSTPAGVEAGPDQRL